MHDQHVSRLSAGIRAKPENGSHFEADAFDCQAIVCKLLTYPFQEDMFYGYLSEAPRWRYSSDLSFCARAGAIGPLFCQ